jgi:uncharacterized protein
MLLCCVKCTSILDKARIEDVEVDHCPSCGGLWLDHGEIERLAKRKLPTDLDRLRRLLGERKGPPAVPSEGLPTCPACTSPMKEAVLGTVTIDYCTRCKGFFLDRGEFDAALATLKANGGGTVAQLVSAAGAVTDETPA